MTGGRRQACRHSRRCKLPPPPRSACLQDRIAESREQCPALLDCVDCLSCAWKLPPSDSPCAPRCKTIVLQDRIEESGEEFLDLLASDDCLFYFCGLKRMYTSVMEVRLRAAMRFAWALEGGTPHRRWEGKGGGGCRPDPCLARQGAPRVGVPPFCNPLPNKDGGVVAALHRWWSGWVRSGAWTPRR